jgi:hypothetical protein
MKHIRSLFTLALTGIAIAGCTTRPPHASAVSTAALSGHITTAQQGVSSAQANVAADEGKAVVIKQWLNQNH